MDAGRETTEVNRGAIRLLSAEEAALEDRTYWHSKTPAERLAAAETLRQVAYGYDPITGRIQAVAQLLQLDRG